MKPSRFAFPKTAVLVGLACALGTAQTPKMPLMAWASWNAYYEDITEAKIKKQADAIVSSELVKSGYSYINIDDGFFDGRNGDGTLKINATRFPNGFKPLVDYIHAKGLKAGFYSDAGSNMCANLFGSETGGKGTGLMGHEKQDIDLAMKTWGVRLHQGRLLRRSPIGIGRTDPLHGHRQRDQGDGPHGHRFQHLPLVVPRRVGGQRGQLVAYRQRHRSVVVARGPHPRHEPLPVGFRQPRSLQRHGHARGGQRELGATTSTRPISRSGASTLPRWCWATTCRT